MRAFKDSAGREWEISITIGAVKRVRDLLKLNGETVDLLSPNSGNPPLITRLFLDLCLLVDVLYALCRPRAQELRISDEEFGASIAGEEAKAAYEAFFEELIDFFQKAGRQDAAKMVAGNLKLIRIGMEQTGHAVDRLAEAGPGIIAEAAAKAVDDAIREAGVVAGGSGKTFTNSPPLPAELIRVP